MGTDCKFTTEKIEGINRVVLGGQIAMSDIPVLRKAIRELCEAGDSPGLAIDLSAVPLIDSTVIGFMISTLKVSAANQGNLALYGLDSTSMETLRVANLVNILPVQPTWEEARSAIEG